MDHKTAAVKMRNITKTFGSVVANDKVWLDIYKGEILALLGENGSGKTTLMNMLAGIYYPDEGKIYKDDQEAVIRSPKDAFDLKIGMIHQHFKLVDLFTAAENIVLGIQEDGKYNLKNVNNRVSEIAEKYGFHIDPQKKIYEMSVSEKQTVEIIKVLYRGADILILDEPTAVLTPKETDELFEVIRRIVREKQMTIIIITHKLYEVMAISDRVGVMRGGELVGVANTADVSERILASMMVGREVLLDALDREDPIVEDNEVAVAVTDLHVADNRGLPAVRGLSLEVHRGEILGIAGIEGNGQSELIEAVTGMRPYTAGQITIGGKSIAGMTPGQVRSLGLAHVPEDRIATGVSGPADITDNLIIGKEREKRFSFAGIHMKMRAVRQYAKQVFDRFDIRGAGVDTAVGSLSGGNMQKVVVAREFSFDTPVLIISQPTRGVDIGAMESIHKFIMEKRNAGCAILLVSADLDELYRLSDRLMTIYEGRITGTFKPDEIPKTEISYFMTGGGREAET
mgnify:CR=1 FL=1